MPEPAQPPEIIGRYRIAGRLGEGGMGTVFKAYDQELDRWVALKKIHAENAGDSRARERLRREARAAAGLKHPAIVGIYDILDAEGSDWIVMELVEGDTLADRLEEGSLDLERVLLLAQEIAEGLAEAHAKGIVHRDLKAENVVVTPSGHARILDFGLAKRLWHSIAEPTLSLEGKVIGTVRSMAPEQALGGKLDHRADLFSLGTMLYEAVTGSSPFLADSPVETLTRVCTFPQPPAIQLNPEIPVELSLLIDRLLEKGPERRPRSAEQVALELEEIRRRLPGASPHLAAGALGRSGEASLPPTVIDGALAAHLSSSAPTVERPVTGTARTEGISRRWPLAAVALAVLAAALWLGRSLWAPAAPPLYVAVIQPELATSTAVAEKHLLPAALRSALMRGLLALDGVSPIDPDQVDALDAPPAEAARALAAGEYLTSSLSCGARGCQTTIVRVRAENGAVLGTASFEVPADSPYQLARAAITHLVRTYPEREADPDAPLLKVSAEGYARYLELRRDYTERRAGISDEEIARRVAEIRRDHPEFLEAYLLESDVRSRIYDVTDDARQIEQAAARLEEASRLAPDDVELLRRRFHLALRVRDLDRAEEIQQRLERLEPGDALVLTGRALLLEAQGQPAEALETLREAAAQRPSWFIVLRLAGMEAAQGYVESARERLEGLLDLAPDNPEILSRIAQLELTTGDLDRAAEIYAQLVQQKPSMPHLHSNYGVARMLGGDYAEAERAFRRTIELSPTSSTYRLNLADTLKLLGREDEAREQYELVVEMTRSESDQSDPNALADRAQALAHLGEHARAITTINEAMRLAPASLDLPFGAALVYLLAGEQVSAMLNARRAIERGMALRWFDLPWFDPLRTTPEFDGLLAESNLQGDQR